MDESRQELLKETVLLSRRKTEMCRDGIKVAIMQIYDQKNGGKFRIERRGGKGTK
jgi:hypothetical protein